jgi:hypothetical protein
LPRHRAEDAHDIVGGSGGSVKNRYPRDACTIEFQIGVNRIEAIERKRLDCGRGAKAGGFTDQPVGTGLITHCRGAMDTL